MDTRNRRSIAVLVAFFVAITTLGGLADNGNGSSTSFYRDLAKKKAATVEDGYRAICILKADKNEEMKFEERRDYLVKEGIVPESWSLQPQTELTKGKLAYLVCKALEIKGGVIMRVFGVSERYALRELAYLRIMPQKSAHFFVSGTELLAVLSRAARYKTKEPVDAEEEEGELETEPKVERSPEGGTPGTTGERK